MIEKTVRELKRGEWFTLKPIDEPSETQVYVRDEYDRTERKYCAYKWSDVNAYRFLKGDKKVYVGFTF